MTDEELKAIWVSGKVGDPYSYVDPYDGGKLLAEVVRLRGLVLATEWRGSGRRCPHYDCNRWEEEGHAEICPAFSATGVLR